MQAKADSLVLLAHSAAWRSTSRRPRLVNHNNANHIIVNGCLVEFVKSCCYLGCMITTDGGAEEDVNCRLNKAQAAFGRMHAVWASSQIFIRIFSSCVKPILLYGSETWLVNNSITQSLQTFVNKCRWIGHTFRKPPDSLSRMALEWNPQGSRKQMTRPIQANLDKVNAGRVSKCQHHSTESYPVEEPFVALCSQED